jgi:hypothetical protein
MHFGFVKKSKREKLIFRGAYKNKKYEIFKVQQNKK